MLPALMAVRSSDWLGVYPATADVQTSKPFKLSNLTLACAGYSASGNCHICSSRTIWA